MSKVNSSRITGGSVNGVIGKKRFDAAIRQIIFEVRNQIDPGGEAILDAVKIVGNQITTIPRPTDAKINFFPQF